MELLKMRNANMYVVNLMMIFYGVIGSHIVVGFTRAPLHARTTPMISAFHLRLLRAPYIALVVLCLPKSSTLPPSKIGRPIHPFPPQYRGRSADLVLSPK
jgi:hypothetical protein